MPDVTDADVHALASSELFCTLSTRQVEAIAAQGSVRECELGEQIVFAGEVGKRLYCLVEGLVHSDLPGPSSRFLPIAPPQVIGWGALVHPYRNLTNVSTVTRARLIEIPATGLQAMLASNHEMRAAVMNQVAMIAVRRIADIFAELNGREPYTGAPPA